tara:strand:- start:402 stop:617 length:216 start_codon:yes stop_codon:yes gene_type:complete
MKIDTKAGAAQLAFALTRKLSIKTNNIIGTEKINKNLFSKSRLKFFINKTKATNRIGPIINICAIKNSKGS